MRLGDCPAGLGNWPCRVSDPAGARNRRKATVKIRGVATKGTIPK